MIGKVFGVLGLVSFVFGVYGGRLGAVGAACVEGAGRAVELSLSLLGMMCLWSGMMQVLEEVGMSRWLSRVLTPLMKPLFPDAMKKGKGGEEIAAAFSANLLGLSNAATPLAVRAMQALAENKGEGEAASDDMVTFTVLGCACPCLLPTTLFALRSNAGSTDPFGILLPVWACSAVCTAVAMLFARLLRHVFPMRGGER